MSAGGGGTTVRNAVPVITEIVNSDFSKGILDGKVIAIRQVGHPIVLRHVFSIDLLACSETDVYVKALDQVTRQTSSTHDHAVSLLPPEANTYNISRPRLESRHGYFNVTVRYFTMQ